MQHSSPLLAGSLYELSYSSLISQSQLHSQKNASQQKSAKALFMIQKKSNVLESSVAKNLNIFRWIQSYKEDSFSFKKNSRLQEELLDYNESTWIRGNFLPKFWNMWKKSVDLTKYENEGQNSRINKILAVNHPNPWVLVCMLMKELLRVESEPLWIER